MIRILIAGDHAMVRAGLRLVLERQPDMTVVAEARKGSEAIARALRLRPTVVVLDIGLSDIDGLDVLERIKASAPQIRVLLLTDLQNEQYLLRSLRRGASGYLLKQSSAADLIRAVRAVARGELVVAWSDTTEMVPAYLQRGRYGLQPPRHSSLTERERDVLGLVAQGYTNTGIAHSLGISPKTVDTHRTHLMDKLDLHTRADLTHYALQHGYLVAPARTGA